MAETVEDFSRAFYPLLYKDGERSQRLMEELRLSLLEKAREGIEVKNRFFEENKDAILARTHFLARPLTGRRWKCGRTR